MRSPGAPSLLVVPTDLEARRLAEIGGFPPGAALQELCGFGPVAAAARTAELVARLKPRRVLLLGIAGTFDAEEAPVASARAFATVTLDGVGSGSGAGFLPPSAMGFPQWPGGHGSHVGPIDESLTLTLPASAAPAGGRLLTVCSAAAGDAERALRRERFPDALGEDMEGFGVALACALAGVPLACVRGISNVVGEGDPGTWKVDEALAAARNLAQRLLGSEWGPDA